MRIRYLPSKLRRRLVRPFVTSTVVVDRTRIRFRTFPPLFELERCDSLQDLVDRGGTVKLERATYLVHDTLLIE